MNKKRSLNKYLFLIEKFVYECLTLIYFYFISENLEELKKEYEKVMEMIKQKPKEKSECMSNEQYVFKVNVLEQIFHWCLNILH